MYKLAVLALITFLGLQQPRGNNTRESTDTLGDKLSFRVQHYELNARNFLQALTQVATDFHITMGVEWVNSPAANVSLMRSWHDRTVAEIIEEVVRSQPRYTVQNYNGVLHISSTDVERNESVTEVRIDNFSVREAPVEVAARQLQSLVKANRASVSQPACGIGMSVAANVDEPTVSIHLEHTTVRDVLDAMVKLSARKIWVVTYSGNSTVSSSGFRRTERIWNSKIPEDAQPVWDLLHWGDSLLGK